MVAGGFRALQQQFLAAELVDEMQFHLAPVLLGDGVRRFDGIDDAEKAHVRPDPRRGARGHHPHHLPGHRLTPACVLPAD